MRSQKHFARLPQALLKSQLQFPKRTSSMAGVDLLGWEARSEKMELREEVGETSWNAVMNWVLT
jgi:hypothetical protein